MVRDTTCYERGVAVSWGGYTGGSGLYAGYARGLKMFLLRAGWLAALLVMVTFLGAGRAAAQAGCLLAPCDDPEDDRRAREGRRATVVVFGDPAVRGGRIVGVILDENGGPIRGAAIVAKNPNAVPTTVAVESDKKGRFGVFSLRDGTWTLVAQKPGYSSVSGAVLVGRWPDAAPPVRLTLRKVSAVTSAPGVPRVEDLQSALAKADELYGGRRWDDAIARYRAILARAPALSAINLQIAAAYRSKGDYEAAIASYNDILKSDPNSSKAKVGIAIANVEQGDLAAAERTLEAASKADGATSEVFYSLAEVKMSKGLTDEASKAYQRAARLDPGWGKPVFALGRLALDKGDKSAAAQYFEIVVAIDPASVEARRARTALEGLER